MTLLDWTILTIASALALAFAYYTYFRREPHGRGRTLLMALRALTLIILALLLIDPRFGGSAGDNRSNTRVVLDASLSMMPRAGDSANWQRAVREAREASNGDVILAGTAARSVHRDSLALITPQLGSSRMLPALQAAAEAGAERVVVVTDGAIEDANDVARWLPRLGVELEIEEIPTAQSPNRAIAELDAPSWAEAGKPINVRVGMIARGVAPNAQTPIVVRQGSDVVARADATLAAEGISSIDLSFNAEGPAEGGLVRYDVAFETTDSIPDDDVRSIYVFVSEKPAGVALVSFLPDWEPRFLHPILAQALGLPVRTFLRLPNNSYVRGGEGLEAGGRADEAAVRRAIAQADLVVLHGVTENAPQWWRDVASSARRLILFPADALAEPFDIDAGLTADWYVAGDIPASPIAAFLQNIDVSEVPPLEMMFTSTPAAGAWVPLLAGRTRRGGRSPVVVAQQVGARRVAIAHGTGFWRWAFRSGASRDLYTRLWGSLAGWLVQDEAQVAGAAIRPVQRAVERAAPLRWIAPGLVVDSLHVQITDANGRVVRQSMATPQRGDTVETAPVAPGHYRYNARAFAGTEQVEASGPLSVETYSAEFTRAAADLSSLRGAPQQLAESARSGGKPLHASAWPYALMVLLLCAEWILRRRWGLR